MKGLGIPREVLSRLYVTLVISGHPYRADNSHPEKHSQRSPSQAVDAAALLNQNRLKYFHYYFGGSQNDIAAPDTPCAPICLKIDRSNHYSA